MNNLTVSRLEVSSASSKHSGGGFLQDVRSRRNVKLVLERQTKQRVFPRFHPREPSLEGFRNKGLEGLSGVFFLVPDFESGTSTP